MKERLWSLTAKWSPLAVALVASMVAVAPAGAAEATGPGGTYECDDRCQSGVGCNTSCYNPQGTLITCNAWHPTCGGMGGVVGQGCGDGICWWDYQRGYESHGNCPADCPPSDVDRDGVPDQSDNCPAISNANQADCDNDGVGTVCDPENGVYVLFSNAGPCRIISRLHAGYIDQTLFREGIFRDVSSCNSPDKWRKIDETTGYCWGFWVTHDTCCNDLWGASLCAALLENNQCHY